MAERSIILPAAALPPAMLEAYKATQVKGAVSIEEWFAAAWPQMTAAAPAGGKVSPAQQLTVAQAIADEEASRVPGPADMPLGCMPEGPVKRHYLRKAGVAIRALGLQIEEDSNG